MIVRMLADSALVTIALGIAVAVRLVIVLTVEMPAGDNPSDHIQVAVHNFLRATPSLLLVLLATFWMSGFYTYSKHYLGKYKAFVVLQAVAVGFLLYGFLSYFLSGGELAIPRGSLAMAWILASILLLGARTWNVVWNRIVVPERETILRHRGPIERVLVIGGAGYIGSALVPLLLKQNYRVRVLDILLFGESPLAGVLDHPRLELVPGDLRNVVTLFRAMEGIDAVVHLGAIVGDPACKFDEDLTIDVNLVSTRVLAEVAKFRGVRRLIFASTCSVYGACEDLLDERSETRPLSLYGRTKLVSERVLLDMVDVAFAPVIMRFATIYGLSGRTRFDLVVNLLTARARLDGEITIHGGNQWRPFVHVEDAARGIVAALAAPHQVVAGEIFNVGSDEQNYTISQVGELVKQRVHEAKLLVDRNSDDPRNYRVSFRKIRQQLEFEPTWTVTDGIQQVLEAIASGKIADYDDPQYSNFKYLLSEGSTKFAKDGWARELLQELHD